MINAREIWCQLVLGPPCQGRGNVAAKVLELDMMISRKKSCTMFSFHSSS